MTEHVCRLLQRALAAWDAYLVGQVDADAMRDSVRVAAGALDGAAIDGRQFFEDWSLSLDAVPTYVNRHHNEEAVRAEMHERGGDFAETIREQSRTDCR